MKSSAPTSDGRPLLEFKDVDTYYGELHVLKKVNYEIYPGEIVCLLGGNASGKSTTMKTVLGVVQPTRGSVNYNGQDISRLRTAERVRRGIAPVPEARRLFPRMTVFENLEMGAFTRRDDITASLDNVYGMFPVLKEKRRQPAGELSGGQRQMVAMGRALMSKPKLLMLDEPSAGLSPRYVLEIFEEIVKVNKAGVAILMVEQNARQALAFASKGFVLTQGQNRFTGTGPELIADPEVAKSFLGG
jgi:branched-chain amino acid transport system ATP-binding protein